MIIGEIKKARASRASGIVTPGPIEGIYPDGTWTDGKLAECALIEMQPVTPNYCNMMNFISATFIEMRAAGIPIAQLQSNFGSDLGYKQPESDS